VSGKGLTIQLDGLEEMADILREAAPAEARRIMKRTIYGVGRQVRDEIRSATPVFTGNLKRAIKFQTSRGSKDLVSGRVYADRSGGRSGKGYHYGLVEYGTVKMAARRFARPIISSWQQRMPQELRTNWENEFVKEMQRRADRVAKGKR
jgi:hypothetical protein